MPRSRILPAILLLTSLAVPVSPVRAEPMPDANVAPTTGAQGQVADPRSVAPLEVPTLVPTAGEIIRKDAPGGGSRARTPIEQAFASLPGVPDDGMRQFGRDLFTGTWTGAGLAADTGVPSSYPLGPGDELILDVPMNPVEFRATVGRDGRVFLAPFGTFGVSGLTLEGFQRLVRQKARGSEVTVRLGRLRTLTVHLAGRVEHPGAYTIGALATLTSLLQMAGGPLPTGSLRDIQVRRGGRLVARFDVYDFLMKGEAAGNIRLEAGDVIFVPAAGPQVALVGAVQQPAIYELVPGTTLQGGLDLAGGLLATAYPSRLEVRRVRPRSGREVKTLDLAQAAGSPLVDGDCVIVPTVLDRLENAVTLAGHVERPGFVEIRPGTRVSQVLGTLADLKPEVHFEYAQIQREVGPDRHLEIVPFHLGKAMARDASHDLVLQPRDTIRVFALSEFQALAEVTVLGPVLRPGKYRLFPGMHVAELVQQAGGLQDEADTGFAELTRTEFLDGKATVRRMPLVPSRFLKGETAQNLELVRDDVLRLRAAAEYHAPWTVALEGEVRHPGTYTLLPGETLEQVIARAGGFTDRAYPRAAVFTRKAVQAQQQRNLADLADRLESAIVAASARADASKDRNVVSLEAQRQLLGRLRATQATGRVVVDLDAPRGTKDTGKLVLDDGDRLVVPAINQTVAVLGAVYTPNALRHVRGNRVQDYLREAGGATPQGDADSMYVVRADGKVHALRSYREGWGIFGNGLLESELGPGDAIVIPERIEYGNTLADITGVVQAVAQVVTSGAVLYNTFTR